MAKPTKPKDAKPKAEDGGNGAAPGGGGSPIDLKLIITIVVIIVASVGSSAASIYFLAPTVLVPAIVESVAAKTGSAEGAEGEGHGEGEEGKEGEHESTVGLNLELDDFTVNLKNDPDQRGNQYLRAKISLSVKVPPEEDCTMMEHKAMAIPKAAANRQLAAVIQGGKFTSIQALETQTSELNEPVAMLAVVPEATVQSVVDKTLLANEGADPTALCYEAFKSNMGAYVPTVRDIINTALMKRTTNSLGTIEGQEALKDEIKEQINQLIGGKYEILRVNFADFIIQH